MKIISIILILATQLFSQPHENKASKYFAGVSGLFVAFSEGAEQGYFFQQEKSNWQPYNKGSAHLWWGARRVAMVGTGLLIANWHPQQQLCSWKTLNQYISYSLLYSWTMNRGLRLVQTGKMFPSEKGHSWYIDAGFIRMEVKSQNWMQWTLLGVGTVGLILDYLYE
jgi:hypothetical protein